MSMLQRLVDQLDRRGLAVKAGAEPGQLLLCGPAAEKTPEILVAVKAFKPYLLDRFGRPDPPPEPLPERPTGPPPGSPVVEGHEVVRSGVCRAKADGRLCWATYRAGGLYWFEEQRLPFDMRGGVRTADGSGTRVPSYRVFGGDGEGRAGPSVFAAMFEECPA